MDVKTADKYFIANTYSRADVVFVSGKGSVLTDDCGKEYIDFGSGIAVNVLGHSYAPWVQAVKLRRIKSRIPAIFISVNLACVLLKSLTNARA